MVRRPEDRALRRLSQWAGNEPSPVQPSLPPLKYPAMEAGPQRVSRSVAWLVEALVSPECSLSLQSQSPAWAVEWAEDLALVSTAAPTVGTAVAMAWALRTAVLVLALQPGARASVPGPWLESAPA